MNLARAAGKLFGDTEPSFLVLANDKDITRYVRDRLVRLSIKDEVGFDSDSLELVLDDRDSLFELPKMGGLLTVSLGYGAKLHFMGVFVADEVELTGPERTLTIVAKASDMVGSLKERKERSWKDTSIGGIVYDIAMEHKLLFKIGKQFASMPIDHVDQTNESDLHFLSRLGRQRGARVKCAGGFLLFVGRGKGETASGLPTSRVRLKPGDVDTWRVRWAERNHYQSVSARYHSVGLAETKSITIGSGKPVYRLRTRLAGLSEATAAATAKLEELKLGVGALDIGLAGRADINAESIVELRGFRGGFDLITKWKDSGVDGEWLVTSVEHTVDDAGYRMRISAERQP